MIGFQLPSRLRVSSATTAGSDRGTLAGRITGDWSCRAHRAWMTVAISRSTPRVRWHRSSVDQFS
ncbi:MAG TPA: hypothetical protein VM942_05020 [Acidimicrobiales bacterium]|nr:hypothetical protein [Acidimicrobiales bacterium]